MNLIILTVLISCIITQCQSACRHISTTNAECSSTKDVKFGDYQDKWTEIKFISNSAYGAIVESDFLKNTPNVKKVMFENHINDIQNNAFQGAAFLRSIYFYMCNLHEIKSTWFTNLPIEDLIIFDSQVSVLKPKCFENTPNLKRVNIRKNTIVRIPSGVFSYTNIEVLYLNNNQIEIIERDAFNQMKYLKILALANNILTTFEPDKYISTSPNMYMLWLSNNYITRISRNNFELFPKLRILLLHFNELDEIEDGAFYGANQLSYLDISNNELTDFSPKIFPSNGLPYMDIFLIQNNRLSYLSTEIIAKFPRLSKMTIGGNPWQCSCYNEFSRYVYNNGVRIICDQEYLDGKRPICVVPARHSNQCIHNSSISDELYPKYNNAIDEYDLLPPLCKIMCEDNKPCYANRFSKLRYDEIS